MPTRLKTRPAAPPLALPAETVRALKKAAEDAAVKAYAPYSHFHVGAAALGANGKIYAGCNVENASYSLTFCAEGSALAAMVSDGERKLQAILVTVDGCPDLVPPCGACRQRIREFGGEKTPVLMSHRDGRVEETTLGVLLPRAFGPDYL